MRNPDRLRRSLAILIVLGLAIAACGSTAHGGDTASLDRFVERSAAVGVVRGVWASDSEPSIEAVGYLVGEEPMPTGQVMPVASLTKMFVAVVVLQLVDEGALTLDDTVTSTLAAWPRGDAITVRHLLLHQSGMVDAEGDFIAAIVSEPERVWTPTEVLAYAAAEPPRFDAPGSDAHYSDTNTQALAAMVEAQTGLGIEAHLYERIIEPLGLDATFYAPVDLDRIDAAEFHGYAEVFEFFGDDAPTDVADLELTALTTGFPASSGLWSNAADLLVFGHALFRSRTLVRDSSLALMLDVNEHGYGHGVEHFDGAVGHRGTFFGAQTAVAYEPVSDRLVVVMANAFDFAATDSRPFTELLAASIAAPS